MNYSENRHTVCTPYSTKVFWKDGSASNCDENPTEVELSGYGNTRYPSVRFELPRQNHELEKVERLMLQAFERGQYEQKIAIGKMMKELIGL